MTAGLDKMKSRIGRYWLGAGVGMVAVFVLVALFLDQRISTSFGQWPPGEQAFFHWITEFGEGAWVLVPALALWILGLIGWALVRAYWWRWSFRALSILSLFVFGAVGIPGLVAAILKRIFGRARPVWLDTEGVFAFRFLEPLRWDYQSFPSGHATTSLAFALTMVIVFGRKAWWVFIPAGLIALSRIVIQMHYLSDVLFGAALGMAGAWFVATYWRERGWVFKPVADGPGWRNRLTPVIAHQIRRLSRRLRGNG